MDTRECFEIFGLEPSASIVEVKQAWRDLVKVWHPDRFANNPRLQKKAEENLKRINEAYKELLSYFEITQSLTPLEPDTRNDGEAHRGSKQDAFTEKEENNPVRSKSMQRDEVGHKPRPWVRYLARLIDYQVFSVLVGLTGAYSLLPLASSPLLSFCLICPVAVSFLWVFVESNLLSVFGTTPGKWILRTSINNIEGGKLGFIDALRRSFLVWLKGVGVGIPFISVVVMLASYYGLKKNEKTIWDREVGSVVAHRRIGIPRTVGIILFLIVCFPLGNFLVQKIIEEQYRMQYSSAFKKSQPLGGSKHDSSQGHDKLTPGLTPSANPSAMLSPRPKMENIIWDDDDPANAAPNANDVIWDAEEKEERLERKEHYFEMSKEDDRVVILGVKSKNKFETNIKNKEDREAFQTQIHSVEVKDMAIDRFCEMLSAISQKRIIADERVKGKISIRVGSCSAIKLIDFLLDEYNLEIRKEGDSLRIVPPNKMVNEEYYLTPSAYDTYVRGMDLWADTRYQEALPFLRKAVEIAPVEAFYYNDLGVALAEKGDFDMALASFGEAISRKKDFAIPNFNIAHIKRGEGKKKEAVAYYAIACNLGHRTACDMYKQLHGGGLHLWYDENGVPNITDRFPPRSNSRVQAGTSGTD